MRAKKTIPKIVAIVAYQMGENEKRVSAGTLVKQEYMPSVLSEIEKEFGVKVQCLPNATIENIAQAIYLVKKFDKICEEMRKFSKRFYNLDVSTNEKLTGVTKKSFLRVIDCYIIKEKIPRKNREHRKVIRESSSIEEAARCIVYGC